MSITSPFLLKHQVLVAQLTASYGETYNIARSESELTMGTFPAIGLFLGISEHSKESRAYAPINYTYILVCFDSYEFETDTDLLEKQQAMFGLMEQIIQEMSFEVLTDIEPVVSIGIEEGSFITGWTSTITFNA
jgi:hypothetical protein